MIISSVGWFFVELLLMLFGGGLLIAWGLWLSHLFKKARIRHIASAVDQALKETNVLCKLLKEVRNDTKSA